MSKTIGRVYPSDFTEGRFNEHKGRYYAMMTYFPNHCANKVARANSRYCMGHPKWWDRLYHTRPRRAKERMGIRRLLIEGGDFDGDVMFPVGKKPHMYYW